MNVSPVCTFCETIEEIINHIIFYCCNVKLFWNTIIQKSFNPTLLNNIIFSSDEWCNTWNLIKNSPFNNFLSWKDLIPFCLWHIWLTRNGNLFNKKKTPINTHYTIAKATEYTILIAKKDVTTKHTINLKWEPPLLGHYKLNIDGSSLGNPGVWGIGGVIRNNRGD
ncbi:hypothetical protein RDI58_019348 [Solanum bulbocastanum]|uniref:Reverse transcriptase zinc-binding domain-containing protein n=1 Tax=Solanum bulbocastanum TaxID=147425 RepID=A0AAN8TAQ6_SOLBU